MYLYKQAKIVYIESNIIDVTMKKDIQVINQLKKYKAASPNGKLRRSYLHTFESTMIYRTTKTENPNTTLALVKRVLAGLNHSV